MTRKANLRVVMVGVFLILACLGSATVNGASPVKITFWSPFPIADGNQPTIALQELVDKFNQTHTDIRVEHVGIPINELAGKYMAVIAAGTVPDVGWGVPIQYYSLNNLVPVEQLAARDKVDTSQFWPGLWRGFAMVDGIQWGWPFEEGAQATVYNKNRVEDAGLPGAPQTWDQFVAYAKKLTDPQKGNYALQPIWWWGEQLPFVWMNNADVLSADGKKVTYTDPKVVEAVQWYGDLEAVHHVIGADVPSGKAAMIWVHSGWYQFSKSFTFDVGYDLLPYPAGGKRATRSFYQELTIFRSTPERIEAAWKFMKWLMDPEQIVYWNTKTGYLPTSRAVLATKTYRNWLNANPGMQAWLDMMNYIRSWPRAGFDEVGNQFMAALNKVRAGQASAKVALEEVQAKAQAEWDKYLATKK